ncbi:hypothetical protein ACU045_03855 [Microbacterium sp. MAHUQ-60]|uniref:hypothetical protein n=1 Tax=unclassified Microbacterium TaxID=2609290 RepID=UPI00360F249D
MEPLWTDVAQVAISALTLVAIAFAALQLIFHSRQMHREFEAMYVVRYWELMDRRSRPFALGQAPTRIDYKIILEYLQLSEDEIDLRQRGRVTDATWAFWSESIIDQCSSPAYVKTLRGLPADRLPQVRNLLTMEAGWDPLNRNWFWRRRHGL